MRNLLKVITLVACAAGTGAALADNNGMYPGQYPGQPPMQQGPMQGLLMQHGYRQGDQHNMRDFWRMKFRLEDRLARETILIGKRELCVQQARSTEKLHQCMRGMRIN